MRKKITYKAVCFFIIGMMLPIFTVCGQKEDVIDQSTPLGYDGYICGIRNDFLAQSFKPKLPILSKIELGLWKLENITGNFTISIRQRIYGRDLISKTISIEDIPWQNYGDWVAFDFEDINVTPDKTYYIVFTSDDAQVVFWIMTLYTPYWRGRPWSFGGSIPFWMPLCLIVKKLPDMSFRTYGYIDI
jgi:hypothetical protein